MSPDLTELEERAKWAIETLGAEGMDGISAVNFAHDLLAVLVEARRVETLREALERISVLDGANAPAGVPTAEFLRSIAHAALEGASDDQTA